MRVIGCLLTEHNIWLVTLAVAMCGAGCAVVAQLFRRSLRTQGLPRYGWQFLTAVCAGGSIWCTHFIAMLGYRPGAGVALDGLFTILSVLIAILGTGLGVAVAARKPPLAAALAGGGVIGLAIAAMHYTGMFAYQVEGVLTWHQGYMLASIGLAVGFAVAFVAAARRWRRGRARHVATGLLALSIMSLHFTGMTAFQVEPIPGAQAGVQADAFRAMALSIALVGFLIVGTGISCYLIDQRTRTHSEEQLRHMALHDPLTGLPNRANFNAHLDRMLRTGREEGVNTAVIAIDLNRFKEINDAWGHGTGDLALAAVAERLRGSMDEHDYVARLGGDEFCAITQFRHEAHLHRFVENLLNLMLQPLRFDDFEATTGASIGVAVHPRDGHDRETLVRNADLAMYRAKSLADEDVCFYDVTMGEAVRDRRALAAELRQALFNDELQVHYQVQRAITDERIIGYEALLRWQHARRGRIPPDEFIPLAEANGLILPLGEWVLRRACQDAARWNPGYKVAVNLSAVQLLHSELPEVVRQILAQTGLPARRLELELTETALIKDRARSLQVITQIRALGVSVALDDFGTGYSSLDTLRSFPFDKIKLDRSFIAAMASNSSSLAIVRAVMALGKSLAIPVLAEGIETPEQLALLRAEACDEAQGYLLGRPASLEELRLDETPAAA